MSIKKNEVVEIDFIAKISSTGEIFDTTYEDIAKENNFSQEVKSLIFPVGKGYVIKGLDENIQKSEMGKEYTYEIKAADAFGNKDVKLMKMFPLSAFKQRKMDPTPGMMFEIDGMKGVVKSNSSGRVIVDFNHPLSGKDLTYEVKINKKIEDNKIKTQSLLELLGFKNTIVNTTDKEIKIGLESKDLPKEVIDHIQNEVKDITGIDNISILSKDLLKKKE